MSGFYAMIPASILDDDRITDQERILYAEISLLCKRRGFCWAKNEFFATKKGVTTRTIRNWIGHLQECGHLELELRGPYRKIYCVSDARRVPESKSYQEACDAAAVTPDDDFVPETTTQDVVVVSSSSDGRRKKNDATMKSDDSVVGNLAQPSYISSKSKKEDNTIQTTSTEISPYGGLADAKEVGKHVLKSMTAVFPITKEEYPYHAKKARQIAERVCEMAPESPTAAADVVLAAFRDLTEHGDGFWRKQPYTATTLASGGIWSRVVAHIRDTYKLYRGKEEPTGDWENFMEDVW